MASNVNVEKFEPFCRWRKTKGSKTKGRKTKDADERDFDELDVYLHGFKKEEIQFWKDRGILSRGSLTIQGERYDDNTKLKFKRHIKFQKDYIVQEIKDTFSGGIYTIKMPVKASLLSNFNMEKIKDIAMNPVDFISGKSCKFTLAATAVVVVAVAEYILLKYL